MKTFIILLKKLFCSTAKRFLLNFIPILKTESFVLSKKAVDNGLSLEICTPFDFQVTT